MKRMIAISVAFAISFPLLGSQSDAMGPFSLRDILTATNGRTTGFDGDETFAGVATDSRTIQPHELFWALPGPNHDGHAFISEALQAGATGVVSQDEPHGWGPVGSPTIHVPDTLQALQDFAGWHRQRQETLVIGVTGSFGKTTTREMIYAALSAGYAGIRSPHNYNNHVGVPLTLLELNNTHEFAVVELGASATGEIETLTKIAGPEIGVITGIGPAHLDGFGSERNIVEAKSELLRGLPGMGFAILAGDDPVVREMAQAATCPTLFVGEDDENDIVATDIHTTKTHIHFRVDGREYKVPAIGRHHVSAALIAIAIGLEIGLSPETLAAGLATYRPAKGRCELRQIGHWYVIDDSYNANPASMRVACEMLEDWNQAGKQIFVAGDMLELGEQSVLRHQEFGAAIGDSHIDHLVTFGTYRDTVASAALKAGMHPANIAVCSSFDTVHTVLDCWLELGDVILVKGSRSLRMERVVAWLEQHANSTSQENNVRVPMRACA